MSENDHELGIIGLGQMGGNIARQANEKGIRVVGNAPSEHEEIQELGIPVYDPDEFGEMAAELSTPRKFYMSVPAGELVDDTIEKLVEHCDEGDVIMDGGNSFWRDSMRRAEYVHDHGLYYMDTGSSGGLPGARDGGCFMVGGPEEGYELVEPILDELSVDGGLIHTGPSGSGHFVKLVHNGIEFGMLQSIAEGVELLEAGQFDLDMEEVFRNWNSGSVIRSWLVELMRKGLAGEFDDTIDEPPADYREMPQFIEDTGEVNWLVQEAFKGETPIPVISQSVIELFKSRGNQQHAPRAVALMRRGFGNHPAGKEEGIAKERLGGRVENEARSTLHERDDGREVVSPKDRDVFGKES
jgi:6-phosphogluconate dehydrogenase